MSVEWFRARREAQVVISPGASTLHRAPALQHRLLDPARIQAAPSPRSWPTQPSHPGM